MKSITNSLKIFKEKYESNKHLRQSVTLMLWNFCSIPLAFVTNMVITRYMGAQAYGDYLYIQKVFDFAFIILGFGALQSVNRAVLLAEDEKHTREYYGSGFISLLIIYTIICIALFAYTLTSHNIREKGLLEFMLCIIPFSLIHYTQSYFEQVLPSSNKITELIIQRYIPRVAMFLMSLTLYLLIRKVNLNLDPVIVVWSLYLGTQTIVYLYVLHRIKPSFANLKSRLKDIIRLDKEFGIQVYLGNLFSTAFTALMPIFLSAFGEDNSGVGFYSLSLMLSQPLSFIPIVVATSHYKEFAEYKSIPGKLIKTTFLISLFAMICLWILVTPFIKIFYTAEFAPVIYLTIISSIGTLFYGFSDFFTRYLMSQGKGKALRNSSFIVGFTTLLLSIVLIPWLHETGASIVHVGAGLVYFIIILFYYIRCVKENSKNK